MKHITNDKGDIGVAKVMADLIERGFSLFLPVSAACPFDLIMYSDKHGFKRIQVKYRNRASNNTLNVDLKRATISNGKVTSATKNIFVDIVAIYCPENNNCYYVNVKYFSKTISLRLDRPRNNQLKGVRLAEDYLEIKI